MLGELVGEVVQTSFDLGRAVHGDRPSERQERSHVLQVPERDRDSVTGLSKPLTEDPLSPFDLRPIERGADFDDVIVRPLLAELGRDAGQGLVRPGLSLMIGLRPRCDALEAKHPRRAVVVGDQVPGTCLGEESVGVDDEVESPLPASAVVLDAEPATPPHRTDQRGRSRATRSWLEPRPTVHVDDLGEGKQALRWRPLHVDDLGPRARSSESRVEIFSLLVIQPGQQQVVAFVRSEPGQVESRAGQKGHASESATLHGHREAGVPEPVEVSGDGSQRYPECCGEVGGGHGIPGVKQQHQGEEPVRSHSPRFSANATGCGAHSVQAGGCVAPDL